VYQWCPTGNCPDNILFITPSNPGICTSGSVALTVSGANTYSWSPSTGLNTTTGATVTASPSVTTTYTVTGTDGSGLTKTSSITVTVNSVPSTPSISIANCNGLKSSSGGTNQWYLNGTLIPAATGQIYLPTQSGNYTVQTVNGGCKSTVSLPFSYSFSLNLEMSCKSSLSINIDGKPDEPAWDGNFKSICKIIFGNGDNVSAGFKTWWDTQYLYIGMDINDAQLNNGSSNVWENSAVELFLDMNNAKTTTYETNDFQYIIGWNNQNLFEKNNRKTGVLFNTANKTGGYTAEIAIPWTTLQVTPSASTKYGFDIGIDVSHTSGSRTGGLVWNGDENNFSNTSKFAEIVIENNCLTTVEKSKIKNDFLLFPNPADAFVIVEGIKMNSQFEFYDVLGNKVFTQSLNASSTIIDIAKFNPGIYFFKIISTGNSYQTGKLIKE
ncbi:MAG: T9SS type A sorting domain-containing protein, partial [Bacteroidetes bacterium]|nr:T9SS type A sorting domain-containing protein [Bacteroidota bacterium]